MFRQIIVILIICFSFKVNCYSQEFISISGRVTDTENYPIMLVNVSVKGTSIGTVTDKYGNYEIKIPAIEVCEIIYSYIGYKTVIIKYYPGKYEENKVKEDVILHMSEEEIDEVTVQSRYESYNTFTRLDAKLFENLPNTSGNIESVIKTLPGVVSTNELSAQYSVRGGNYDENLIYVNDIEIYRPFLVRSGQQEGLSFINSDLINSINFSAGGFDAQYGDKMSSVLDIKYKKPTDFRGSFSASLLGVTSHLEGISKNKKLTHISGFRYKTNQYLLNSLETQGEYNPNFYDFQTFITYQLTKKLEINVLGHISQNNYNFIPEARKTATGTFATQLSLDVFYDGQELDKFGTYFGAVSINYKPQENLELKFITSSFNTKEQETYDIQGQYFINLLDKGTDKETDTTLNIGVGTFLDHARNYLNATVLSFTHKGSYQFEARKLLWGITYQKESISDKINEWRMVDSAGYSIPYSGTEVLLERHYNSGGAINSDRISSFVQNVYNFQAGNSKIDIILGLRGSYWSINNEFIFSPRGSIVMHPGWKRDFIFKFASGVYFQPPFFKELHTPSGDLNLEISAQKSIHYVFTTDYVFKIWNRPFKWVTDVYYKKMDNLIPYKVDNVRIRYAGENIAQGYAMGIDTKINGEFVKGSESWISLSIMETKEDIDGDYYYIDSVKIEPGYYRRPTDQRFSLNLFFQDYLPNNPAYKMSLNLVYGSKLPFSDPYSKRYDEGVQAQLKAYKRVDIGFSKVIKRESKTYNSAFINRFNSIWVGVEIFNLFGIKNEVSKSWVKTLSDRSGDIKELFVGNHLTGRRYNIKLSAKF